MEHNLIMLVVAHKKTNNIPYDRSIIKVGNNDFEAEFSDNSGINIADKNYCYCELTALYYAYKNLDYDYLSLEHYRRFFYEGKNIISRGSMTNLLTEYDVVIPKVNYIRKTTFNEYAYGNKGSEIDPSYKHDLDVLREVFLEKHPATIL